MLRITLKRLVDAGAVLGSIAIYCRDQNGESVIEGISCRKLVIIDAGKSRTFDVSGDNPELLAVLETEEDRKILGRICLSEDLVEHNLLLKCKLNLSNAPKFTFEEVKKRKTWFSKFNSQTRVIIIIFLVVFAVVAFNVVGEVYFYQKTLSKKPEQFTADGISITLSEAFSRDYSDTRAHATFVTQTCIVIIDRLDYEEYPDSISMTAAEYCEQVKLANGNMTSTVREKDGLTYFVYRAGEEKFHFYAYKTDTAMWAVQFGAPEDKVDHWEDCFPEWAKSVKFD